MSRPLICQPDLPNIWKMGPPFPDAECIHCNLCTSEFITRVYILVLYTLTSNMYLIRIYEYKNGKY
jgi:hypothetical protein